MDKITPSYSINHCKWSLQSFGEEWIVDLLRQGITLIHMVLEGYGDNLFPTVNNCQSSLEKQTGAISYII